MLNVSSTIIIIAQIEYDLTLQWRCLWRRIHIIFARHFGMQHDIKILATARVIHRVSTAATRHRLTSPQLAQLFPRHAANDRTDAEQAGQARAELAVACGEQEHLEDQVRVEREEREVVEGEEVQVDFDAVLGEEVEDEAIAEDIRSRLESWLARHGTKGAS